jgi:SecD/SecF fusion protein
MKSIVYILLAVFISSILLTAVPTSLWAKDPVIKIQCDDSSYSVGLLNESAEIIKKRLNDYGVRKYKLSVIEAERSIEISLGSNDDLPQIINLVVAKGRLEFYETIDRSEFISQLKGENKLFTLLDVPSENSLQFKPAVLGFSKDGYKEEANAYIHSPMFNEKRFPDVKFCWGRPATSKGGNELFILKKTPGLTGKQVSKCKSSATKYGGLNVNITFNSQGAQQWEDLTTRCLDKPLAIVLDNEVYSAPKVMQTIKGGKCMISGNFSAEEAGSLACLINNHELPLNFKVIK